MNRILEMDVSAPEQMDIEVRLLCKLEILLYTGEKTKQKNS